jgi:hypothetical protein
MCFIVSERMIREMGWEGKGKGKSKRANDIGVVPKGSKITFTTETFGLGFFVGQRKVSAHGKKFGDRC